MALRRNVLVGIPQGFIKITVIFKKAHRNFHGIRPKYFTEFAGIFHGISRNFIPSEEFRGILFRRKSSA